MWHVPFLAVCLTVCLFEFWPQIFTIRNYGFRVQLICNGSLPTDDENNAWQEDKEAREEISVGHLIATVQRLITVGAVEQLCVF